MRRIDLIAHRRAWVLAGVGLFAVGLLFAVLRPAAGPDAPATNAPAAALNTARPAPAHPVVGSFRATFALANGAQVLLDYIDPQNYRFSSGIGGLETIVLGGNIYLRQPPTAADPALFYLVGTLVPQPDFRPRASPPPPMQPTTIPPAGVARWGNVGGVFDVQVPAAGPMGIPIDVTVAQSGRLASAQWYIASMLLPAMDMRLCGDAVQAVTTWWPQSLTAAGFAVVATGAGVRLDSPLGDAQILAIPDDAEIFAISTPRPRI